MRAFLAGAVTPLLLFTGSQPATAQSTEPPAPLVPAAVSVDFGGQEGALPRPERYNNFTSANLWNENDQRADDAGFYNEQGLRGEIYRVWLGAVFDECDVESATCDFSAETDAYLSDASAMSDSVLAVLNPSAFVRGQRPLAELQPLLEVIFKHLREKYPAVRYIEVFNEPDWSYHGLQRRMGQEPLLQPEELYTFYVPFYEAANEVNKDVREADRLRIGGPALMWLDAKWMEPFLDGYAADPDPGKRLDFLSHHAYLSWTDDYRVPTFYKGDLSQVASERETVLNWLKERGLSKHIPSFVTETGIYPGPSSDDPNPSTKDFIRQAAGLATYGYWYSNQPDIHMFNWVVRHQTEWRKDQLVTLRPETAPDASSPPGVGEPLPRTFTPYGNMLLMQSKMKDTRVSAVSHAPLLDSDNGIYATASTDKTGAALMVWNWQHIHDNSYRTTIDMSRLPAELRDSPVRQRMYRIDATTSNYFTNPDTANLQLVDEKIVTPGKTHTETIDLGPNAIYLILLERA